MKVDVLKSISNRRYARRKKPDWFALAFLSKRIWFHHEIPVECDRNIIYRAKCERGMELECIILDKGFDETGFYVVAYILTINDEHGYTIMKNKRLPCGIVEVNEVFNPHKDEAFQMLCHSDGLGAFEFHNTRMNFSRDKDTIKLQLELGMLADQSFEITLEGFISEQELYESENRLENIMNRVSFIDFRKEEDGIYRIHIDHSFTEFIPGEKKNTLLAVEHKNQFDVRCRSLLVERFHYFEYRLELLGIQFEKIQDADIAAVLRKKWLEQFVANTDINGIYLDYFMWHVFSYERLPAACRDEADMLVDQVQSDIIWIFWEKSDGLCYKLKNAKSFNHILVQCYQDVYVVDENFNWTYIRTHEQEQCGPYFYARQA